MTVRIDEATCAQVAKFLPEAIRRAFDMYYEYIKSDWKIGAGEKESRAPDKLFADHNAACKTALSHIELLLKLGTTAGIETRADYTHLAIVRMGIDEANKRRAEEVPEEDEE